MSQKMLNLVASLLLVIPHPLNEISQAFLSTHSSKLIDPRCYKECFKKYFFSQLQFDFIISVI